MTGSHLLDGALAILMSALAWWSVTARSGFASLTGFIAYGSLLMLAWMRLRAPDVAMTEGAISTGLSGLVFFRALSRSEGQARSVDPVRPALPVRGAAAVLCGVIAAGVAWVVLQPSSPAPTLATTAAEQLPRLGLGNPVNGVLLGFRALDTLLEKVVLLLALIGVWSLAASGASPGAPRVAAEPSHGSITLLGRVLPPIGLLFAFYLLWNSADHPGGAFASAAILTAMALLLLMTGIIRLPSIASRGLRLSVIAGPVVFIVVAFAGIVTTRAFLAYPDAWAKALIIAIEVPLTISVAVMLALLVAGPPVERTA
ncbi:MAG: DUF4040 domain-containing protein [Phycisphaeraceae bacterium]|nr:DUF4040 domain-containing protein [Phycisphaeraceae bacterium]